MLAQVLVRAGRFYRIEVSGNLFGEYSVLREWGGTRGSRRLLLCFANLREACQAAEICARRMQHQGYKSKEWIR
jgi:hypothetical protein